MKQTRETLHVSTKHKGLRIAGFLLALAVAVTAFSVGITSLGRKDPGPQTVEASPSEEAVRYAAGISLTYDFLGDSRQIKADSKAVTECYSQALLRAYQLLDAENTYEGLGNLAALNAAPGEVVTVAPELAAVLEDAAARSGRGGFHLFAGPLYALWDSILSVEDVTEVDSDMGRRLRALADMLREGDCGAVEILDREAGTVRLTLSPGYAALLAEQEYEGPVLDLNRMREAYLLSMVRDALEAAGYRNGYLATDSGLTLTLSQYGAGRYPLYVLGEEGPRRGATLAGGSGSACSQLRVFSLGEAVGYRQVGETLLHPNLSWETGSLPENLSSLTVTRRDGDILACQEAALTLFCSGDPASEIPAGAEAVWTYLSDSAWEIHTNAPALVEAEPLQ